MAEEVRRLIYTTNIIEGFHRQLRKVTKNKEGAFPNDEALSKLLYLVTQDVTAKWRGVEHWPFILAQLAVFFEERVTDHLA